jgi:DNA-binding NarL/FixJ family response regulator
LLVDDHAMIRAGLRKLLEAEQGLQVVGEASNGRAAVEMTRELQPDVVVMDIRMPDLNGVDATRQAIAARPDVKIIALSANSDERSTGEMLRAGARGYVVKDAAYDELVAAIRAVSSGQVYFSPAVADRLAADLRNGGSAIGGDADADAGTANAESVYNRLTSREREILQLIAEGKATKEVAAILHVSVKTAETHRRNIMEKLGIDSIAELTKYAIREGLTTV